MKFMTVKDQQWKAIKEIYYEAFPKQERKPFFTLRDSVRSGKAQLFTAVENDTLLGFVVVIPYQNMVMVDYLAVSQKVRSKGTGSYLMNQICQQFPGKKIVLLIERLDETAKNREQRIARRRFYQKNGFFSSDIFTSGAGGNMEIMNYGGIVSPEEYLTIDGKRRKICNTLYEPVCIKFLLLSFVRIQTTNRIDL